MRRTNIQHLKSSTDRVFQKNQNNIFSDDDDDDDDESCCPVDSKFSQFWSWQPKKDNELLNFFRESSIHGLKNIGQKDLRLVQRIFWTVAVLCSLGVSFYLIQLGVIEPFYANPVIISFQSEEITIDQIPFPAFTLCNSNKIKYSSMEANAKIIRNYTKRYLNNESTEYVPRDEYNVMLRLATYCEGTNSFSRHFGYSTIGGESLPSSLEITLEDPNNKYYRENIRPKVMESFHQCTDMILLCLWEQQEVPCHELFNPILTEFGYCCVFNMMPQFILRKLKQNDPSVLPKEQKMNESTVNKWTAWDVDATLGNLLHPNSADSFGEFPRRQKQAGMSSGLSILVNPELNEYYCTAVDGKGFRAEVHSPINFPHVVDFGHAVRPHTETFVAVQAEITIADENLRDLENVTRQCYFFGEYNLTGFKLYTQRNCLDQCMADLTFKNCSCVHYYMPRTPSQKLCTRDELDCLMSLRKNLTRFGIKKTCQSCLPSCTQLEYLAETTHLPMREDVNLWENFSTKLTETWANKSVGIIHVYFAKNTVNSKARQKLYGIEDILANAGGLLGLTLGISVISLVEPIYYFSVRLICKIIHKKHQDKKAQMEQNDKRLSISNGYNGLREFIRGSSTKKIKPDAALFPVHTMLVNPGDFIKWSDPYTTKNASMQPRWIRFP